jgi:hypothetical protein
MNTNMNTIEVKTIYNTPTDLRFSLVEKTVWCNSNGNGNGGTWSTINATTETLTIDDSSSGALRFKSYVTGETFLVALGIHGGSRWCYVRVDLSVDQTATKIHSGFYGSGDAEDNPLMDPALDKMEVESARGNYKKVAVEFNTTMTGTVFSITVS